MATKKVKKDVKIHTGHWTETGFQTSQQPVVKVKVPKPKRIDDLDRLA